MARIFFHAVYIASAVDGIVYKWVIKTNQSIAHIFIRVVNVLNGYHGIQAHALVGSESMHSICDYLKIRYE